MSDEELISPADNSIKKSSSWNWIWPYVVWAIIFKLFGPVSGLIAIGAYYWLRKKVGTWSAVAISGVLGVSAAIGLSATLHSITSTSSEALPNASSHAEMPKRLMSDAEVFGTKPNNALDSKLLMSDSEVFGTAPNNAPNSKPTFDSRGWTQENTGSSEVGPWLSYSPHGTRYCRYADRTIQRLYPPGVMPNAEEANPFCLGESSESVPP